MKFPWTKREGASEDRVSQLEQRAEEVREYVVEANAVADSRRDEVRETSKWLRDRRRANHLTELFFDLRGGRP